MTTKAALLRAIRGTCLDCSCGQPGEVRKCAVRTCPLWPFRMGLDPEPSPTRGFAGSARRVVDIAASGTSRQQPSRGAGRPIAGIGA